MKSAAVTVVAIILIAVAAWHEIAQRSAHEQFFEDMRDFKNAGGRFTKHDGVALCEAISNAHVKHGIEPIDCTNILEEKP